VILAVLAVAAVTAEAGIISWVGLLIPHASRKLTGSDTSYSLPVTMLLGGIFVLLADTAARSLLAGEIPLGLITSLAGAVLFSVLMMLREVES
jgi:iron complex transport system permease protein